ncbi:MAG: hypothetical protein ACXWLH_02550 [Candidatus Saccharimonadales bacterium]
MTEPNPIDQFKAVYEAREQLEVDLEAASMQTRNTFAQAGERAAQREAELAADPEVRAYFRSLGALPVSSEVELLRRAISPTWKNTHNWE